jgi:hypothetical protein
LQEKFNNRGRTQLVRIYLFFLRPLLSIRNQLHSQDCFCVRPSKSKKVKAG